MKKYLSTSGIIAVFVIGASALTARAATMAITAKFSPDINNPRNTEFTNTTKQSGYCVSLPEQCADGQLSIDMGGITARLSSPGFMANSEPRQGMYFKMPGAWRYIFVRNREDNTVHNLRFRVNVFSARYHTKNNWSLDVHQNNWNGSSFVNTPAPCIYTGVGIYPQFQYSWIWKWPASDSACYKTAKKDLAGEPYLVDRISLGYQIIQPSPLAMNSGVYEGSLRLSVGPGGDIDFGDNLQSSDTELTLNFSLTVNHELKVTPLPGATDVTLYPCYYGSACSKESAEKNWERWMVTNIPPQKMSGTSRFNLSSSGSFTVYMTCGSGAAQSADSCPMISNKSKTAVPVKALLTLPDNITDLTGQRVVNKPLYTTKDISKNWFVTSSFGKDRSGQVDFVIDKKDIGEMLKSRPDNWSGTVTLIFDPNLY
ncbi:hypothetical protein SME41J_48490 (plasmid) [Serratia marcescens]|nr:hypothetical protein SME41J_48490 [Serratia marcescens]